MPKINILKRTKEYTHFEIKEPKYQFYFHLYLYETRIGLHMNTKRKDIEGLVWGKLHKQKPKEDELVMTCEMHLHKECIDVRVVAHECLHAALAHYRITEGLPEFLETHPDDNEENLCHLLSYYCSIAYSIIYNEF